MADALDSGSSGSNPVRVQVPFSAVNRNKKPPEIQGFSVVFFMYFLKWGRRGANSILHLLKLPCLRHPYKL